MTTLAKAAGASILIFLALVTWALIGHATYVWASTPWNPDGVDVAVLSAIFAAAVGSTAGAITVIRS